MEKHNKFETSAILRLLVLCIFSLTITSCSFAVKPIKVKKSGHKIVTQDFNDTKYIYTPVYITVLSQKAVSAEKIGNLMGMTYGFPVFSFDQIFYLKKSDEKKTKIKKGEMRKEEEEKEYRINKVVMNKVKNLITTNSPCVFYIEDANLKKLKILNNLINSRQKRIGSLNIIINYADSTTIENICNKSKACLANFNLGTQNNTDNRGNRLRALYNNNDIQEIIDHKKNDANENMKKFIECKSIADFVDISNIELQSFCDNDKILDNNISKNDIHKITAKNKGNSKLYILSSDISVNPQQAFNEVISFVHEIMRKNNFASL